MRRALPLLLFAALIATAPAAAAPAADWLPTARPVPGGIAVVKLESALGGTPPEVRFGERRVLVRRAQGGWVALVGLPLAQAPGVSGATDLGDGRPALVLDLIALSTGLYRRPAPTEVRG